MPKQAMIRSFSMRAEEMVSQYRIQRISSSHEGNSQQDNETDRKMEEISKNAIQEVDEMAENVEENEDNPPTDQNLPGTVN
jgi:hypothetical protein